MRKGGSVRRNRPGRRENKKILIVTEGEITEVQYLQGLAQYLRTAGVTVVPCAIQSGGGEPSRVLAKARDLASKGEYEAVWLVVDIDEHASLDDVLRTCTTGGGKHLPTSFPFDRVDQAVDMATHKDRQSAPNTRGVNPSSAMPHLVEALRRT